MADQRIDPYRNYRYRLEIDNIQIAGFSQVTISDSTSNPIDYREGTDPTTMRKLSGLTAYGAVSLNRGITRSMDLYDWRKSIVELGTDGPQARRNVSIILVDDAGQDTARWDIVNAWPSKYTPGQLDAKGSDVLLETFEVTHEGMSRVN